MKHTKEPDGGVVANVTRGTDGEDVQGHLWIFCSIAGSIYRGRHVEPSIVMHHAASREGGCVDLRHRQSTANLAAYNPAQWQSHAQTGIEWTADW